MFLPRRGLFADGSEEGAHSSHPAIGDDIGFEIGYAPIHFEDEVVAIVGIIGSTLDSLPVDQQPVARCREVSCCAPRIAQAIAGVLMAPRDPARLAGLNSRADDSFVRQRFEENLTDLAEQASVARVFVLNADLALVLDTEPIVPNDWDFFEWQLEQSNLGPVFDGTADGDIDTTPFLASDGFYYIHGYAPVSDEGEVVAIVGVVDSVTSDSICHVEP